MSTKIFLSNDPSDVSGYLRAYINEKGPNTSSTVSTAVTNTVAGVTTTTVAMTLTAGGTAAKWITVPLAAAVTVSTAPVGNSWGKESNASANADVVFALSQYTTSIQTAFLTTSIGTELTTTIARSPWVSSSTETLTSTAFSAGDRLAIVPALGAAVGAQMGGSQTVTMDYNGSSSAADGDTYLILNEDLEPGQTQVGSGTTPGIKAAGVSYFYNLAQTVLNAQNAGLFDSSATAQTIVDEANNQKALV